MGKWKIYSKNGTEKYTVDKLEYKDEWMGEEYVMVRVSSPTPINLEIGDYLIYRGLTYSVFNVPSALKQARSGSYGEAFVCDNVKLSSLGAELADVRFHDIVLNDNDIHYTTLPTFSFYCATVDDLLDRLQANANKLTGRQWFFISPSYNRTVQRYSDNLAAQATAIILWENTFGSTHTEPDYVKQNVNISADKISVWDAMSFINKNFGLNFIRRDRVVVVGGEGIPTGHIFQYGKGNGLTSIERLSEDSQQVVTKLYAYGSNKNLPLRYYATVPYETSATVIYQDRALFDSEDVPALHLLVVDIDWKDDLFFEDDVKLAIGDSVVVATPREMYANPSIRWIWPDDDPNPDHNRQAYLNSDGKVALEIKSVLSGTFVIGQTNVYNQKIVFAFDDYSDGINFPSDHKENILQPVIPNNMAVNVLMLPGFPHYSLNDLCKCVYDSQNDVTKFYIRKTNEDSWPLEPFVVVDGSHLIEFSNEALRPYLISPNAAEIGIKEGDIFFTEEDDDNGLEDVHPSIEGMTVGDISGTSSTERIDEILSVDTIADDGVYIGEDSAAPNFNIYLKNVGFDLKKAYEKSGEGMIISLKDGYCGGRDFNVKGVHSADNGTWRLNVERCADDSLELFFPYSDSVAHGESAKANEPYQIRQGDHFVLTEIYIEDTTYIWAASVKALRKAILWLVNNDFTRFTYTPKVDNIYMARQQEEAEIYNLTSLHDKLKAGYIMEFSDSDLAVDGKIFIDSLSINENSDGGIPSYDVVLRNDKQVGTLERIQNKINSVSSIIAGGGAGLNNEQVRAIVDGYGEDLFLSKKKEDSAQSPIVFNKGLYVKEKYRYGFDSNGRVTAAELIASILQSPEFVEARGMIGKGFGVSLSDGSATMQTDNLVVLGQMIVNSLNIREVNYIGGVYMLTPAGSTVFGVLPLYTENNDTKITKEWTTEGSGDVVGYRLLWKADDGSVSTMNYWKQGDQAYCHTFNISEAGHYDNVSNKHYWRLVCRVGQMTIDDVVYHYADLANVINIYLYDDEDEPILNTEGSLLFKGYQQTVGFEQSIPSEGDKVVAFGSQSDTSRQAIIQISSEGIGSIGIYDGINDYGTLSDYEVHYFGKDAVRMRADKFMWTTAGSTPKPPTIYRGDWVVGTTSRWGDSWNYNNKRYTCCLSSGTTTEAPGTTPANWIEEKGIKGDDGKTIKTVTVFCPSIKQPTTPTGNTVPPAGWSLSPSVFGNGTDGTHAAWRELKGNNVNNAFVKERILIKATEATTLTLEFAASSESNYDFMAVGSLNTPIETRSNVTSLPTANKASGTESKSIDISLTAGEHFIDVVYSKDSSASTNLDRGWYKYTIPSGVTMEIEDNKIWASVATFENNVLSGSWSTPVQWDGTNGKDGANGEDGADAWTVIASPNPLILTQALSGTGGTTTFGLPLDINLTAKCGDGVATVGTPTSVSNNAGLTITAGSGKLTISEISKIDNEYKTRGTITCNIPLSYNGRSASLAFSISVGINLMGEFKTTIEGDVETSVAKSIGNAIDPSGQMTSFEQIGRYVRSSAENITTLQQTVGDEDSGLVKKTSEISQRVDDINLFVSETTNENLMPNPIFAEYNPFTHGTNSITGISSGLAYIRNTGDTSDFHSPWERYGGMLVKIGINSNTNASTQSVYAENSYVSNPRVHLTAGKTYTFSVYVAGINLSNNLGGDKRIAELSFYSSATGSSRTMKPIKLVNTTGNASKRFVQYAVTFTVASGYEYLTWIPLLDVGARKYNFYAIYAGVKLEEGGVPTVLSYDAIDGLIKTGISIENNSIKASTNNFSIHNNVTVKDGYVTRKFINDDIVENDYGAEQTFGIDTFGAMTSPDGAPIQGAMLRRVTTMLSITDNTQITYGAWFKPIFKVVGTAYTLQTIRALSDMIVLYTPLQINRTAPVVICLPPAKDMVGQELTVINAVYNSVDQSNPYPTVKLVLVDPYEFEELTPTWAYGDTGYGFFWPIEKNGSYSRTYNNLVITDYSSITLRAVEGVRSGTGSDSSMGEWVVVNAVKRNV
ncbi:hypothetical protein [Prevotella sp. E2-28]|uniref:hypothetical protein n=1 Tax=Prevotella sp. E2-28 TaxID=2913620 RepID=UPI001EDB2ECB|nr:hypothetical protein [Prevotella sp. E2-28]UKK52659.1 hypothetical protein L6465_08575 [Prevotella sp. E2-28]